MRKSAGVLLYRLVDKLPQFFLVHPGGPFWKGKDAGAWSIPKGEFSDDEDPLHAAQREFLEETGTAVEGKFIALTPVQQKGGKQVCCWALEGDMEAEKIQSNTFRQEWPYKSGKWNDYPEVDKAGWFFIDEAKQKINPAQAALLDELVQILESSF